MVAFAIENLALTYGQARVIKVFPINEDEAAAKRTEFLAEWTAAVATSK